MSAQLQPAPADTDDQKLQFSLTAFSACSACPEPQCSTAEQHHMVTVLPPTASSTTSGPCTPYFEPVHPLRKHTSKVLLRLPTMHARLHTSNHCWTSDPQRLLWPVQRRCSKVACRTANIAPDLVQLERSCLADLSTEELELQLKKHGGYATAGVHNCSTRSNFSLLTLLP